MNDCQGKHCDDSQCKDPFCTYSDEWNIVNFSRKLFDVVTFLSRVADDPKIETRIEKLKQEGFGVGDLQSMKEQSLLAIHKVSYIYDLLAESAFGIPVKEPQKSMDGCLSNQQVVTGQIVNIQQPNGVFIEEIQENEMSQDIDKRLDELQAMEDAYDESERKSREDARISQDGRISQDLESGGYFGCGYSSDGDVTSRKVVLEKKNPKKYVTIKTCPSCTQKFPVDEMYRTECKHVICANCYCVLEYANFETVQCLVCQMITRVEHPMQISPKKQRFDATDENNNCISNNNFDNSGKQLAIREVYNNNCIHCDSSCVNSIATYNCYKHHYCKSCHKMATAAQWICPICN